MVASRVRSVEKYSVELAGTLDPFVVEIWVRFAFIRSFSFVLKTV